jgi:hypothetical protein
MQLGKADNASCVYVLRMRVGQVRRGMSSLIWNIWSLGLRLGAREYVYPLDVDSVYGKRVRQHTIPRSVIASRLFVLPDLLGNIGGDAC